MPIHLVIVRVEIVDGYRCLYHILRVVDTTLERVYAQSTVFTEQEQALVGRGYQIQFLLVSREPDSVLKVLAQ